MVSSCFDIGHEKEKKKLNYVLIRNKNNIGKNNQQA